MRDALSIFDQLVAFCGTNITYEQTIAVLNVLNTDYYFQLVDAALRHDVTASLLLFNDVLAHGFDASHFVTGLAQHLRDVLVSKDPQTLPLLETSDSIRQRYADQAAHCVPVWLFQALDILNTCDINYRTARNKRLMVEIALVKLCQLGVQVVVPSNPSKPSAPSKPSSPSSPSSPSAPSMPKMPKISLGLGLKKDAGQPAPQPSQAPETPKQEENRPFTDDQLKGAWVGLAASHADELRLKQLIETYTPSLISETSAQIKMPNPWQMKELQKAMPALLQQLRATLHNNLIEIQVLQEEFNQEQMAFTAEEKYALMAEQNPALAQMKELLDLQID